VKPQVGVLALQGDYEKHAELLSELGVDASTVRTPPQLEQVDGLILPGGESTTVRKLLVTSGLLAPLLRFAAEKPVLGTCAGLILMAHRLLDAGGVEPLGLLDVDVRRNGFGRQIDSFEAELGLADAALALPQAARGVFIRAPRIARVGPAVRVLAVYGQEPVAVQQERHVGLSFHPELSGDPRWHRHWLRGVGVRS
jgi:5'-phosphate synthase pdxT subunit